MQHVYLWSKVLKNQEAKDFPADEKENNDKKFSPPILKVRCSRVDACLCVASNFSSNVRAYICRHVCFASTIPQLEHGASHTK